MRKGRLLHTCFSVVLHNSRLRSPKQMAQPDCSKVVSPSLACLSPVRLIIASSSLALTLGVGAWSWSDLTGLEDIGKSGIDP